MTLTLTLTDQLASGKSMKRLGVNKHSHKIMSYPDGRFLDWRKVASDELLLQRASWLPEVKMALPLREDLVLRVSYRQLVNRVRDLSGMLDAMQHLFEYCELIENDGQIKGIVWEYPWRTDGPSAVITLMTQGGPHDSRSSRQNVRPSPDKPRLRIDQSEALRSKNRGRRDRG